MFRHSAACGALAWLLMFSAAPSATAVLISREAPSLAEQRFEDASMPALMQRAGRLLNDSSVSKLTAASRGTLKHFAADHPREAEQMVGVAHGVPALISNDMHRRVREAIALVEQRLHAEVQSASLKRLGEIAQAALKETGVTEDLRMLAKAAAKSGGNVTSSGGYMPNPIDAFQAGLTIQGGLPVGMVGASEYSGWAVDVFFAIKTSPSQEVFCLSAKFGIQSNGYNPRHYSMLHGYLFFGGASMDAITDKRNRFTWGLQAGPSVYEDTPLQALNFFSAEAAFTFESYNTFRNIESFKVAVCSYPADVCYEDLGSWFIVLFAEFTYCFV